MKLRAGFIIFTILGLMATPALTQEQNYLEQETELYANCMTEAKVDPEASLDMGLTWRDIGGGLPARHCVAISHTNLGNYGAAALEFEALADEMTRGAGWTFDGVPHPNSRGLLAEVYAQGGNAWLLAGDPVKAFDLFTLGIEAAEEKTATYANLLIDRALANGEMGEYQGAINDLTAVQGMVRPNADLFVLKASAYRGLKKYSEAMVELENAFKVDPGNREGLLERGNLLREMGDKAGARENWIAYLREYPNGPAADLVRRNLETMDVKVEDFE